MTLRGRLGATSKATKRAEGRKKKKSLRVPPRSFVDKPRGCAPDVPRKEIADPEKFRAFRATRYRELPRVACAMGTEWKAPDTTGKPRTFDAFFGVTTEHPLLDEGTPELSPPPARIDSVATQPLRSPIESSEIAGCVEPYQHPHHQAPTPPGRHSARRTLPCGAVIAAIGSLSHGGVALKIVKVDGVGDFVVGAKLASRLRKETFNIYRTLKVMGRELFRCDRSTLVQELIERRVVDRGTRSVTLVRANDATDYIDRVATREPTPANPRKRRSEWSDDDVLDSSCGQYLASGDPPGYYPEPPAYVILAGMARAHH